MNHLMRPLVIPPAERAVLVRARALLSSADRWTRGAVARRADGTPCDSRDQRAVAWCLVGAIEATEEPRNAIEGAAALLEEYTGGDRLTTWNDRQGRLYADILWLFDLVLGPVAETGEEPGR